MGVWWWWWGTQLPLVLFAMGKGRDPVPEELGAPAIEETASIMFVTRVLQKGKLLCSCREVFFFLFFLKKVFNFSGFLLK